MSNDSPIDEITEEILLDFIDRKINEMTCSISEFDYVMQIINEKGIKTYSF